MVVKWKCPKCSQEMYSAWDNRDEKNIQCIYCGYKYENKYYKEKNNTKETI